MEVYTARQFPTLVRPDATTLLVTVLSKEFGNDVERRGFRMCEEDPNVPAGLVNNQQVRQEAIIQEYHTIFCFITARVIQC